MPTRDMDAIEVTIKNFPPLNYSNNNHWYDL